MKKSNEGGEKSRAIGKYFFFCSKKRSDDTQCRFARPVDLEINKQKAREGAIKAAKERLKEMGPKREPVKSKQICKFFAKKGVCKKGKKCEFSHDNIQSKKAKAEALLVSNKEQEDSEDDAGSSDARSSDASSSESDSNSSPD